MQVVSPYKTAAELKIEQWEHDALVALIGPLSRSELAFDMTEPTYECGCACCIGGWVDAGNNDTKASIETAYAGGSLKELYFPFIRTGAYRATAPQGARAIVNFLTLGDPRWDDVMSDDA